MWARVLICPEAMRSTVLVIEMTLSSAETELGLPVGGQGVHKVPHALSLIRDREVCVARLKDVDGHIVPVSDLLPANEEIGEDGSGVGHMSALKE
jgi:hypothetical protein